MLAETKIRQNGANLIDFEFEGGTRLRALSMLWRLYPDYSFRRSVLKALNGINLMTIRVRSPKMERLEKVKALLPTISDWEARAFLIHKIDQNSRVYIFDQDKNGRLTAVTKVALNEAAAEGIYRENEVLTYLAGRTVFNIPKILDFQSWKDGCLIRMSAAPFDQSIHDKLMPLPDELFHAVAGLRPASSPKWLRAGSIQGWQTARARATTPLICAIADQIGVNDDFEITAAHRDLGSENIFSNPSPQNVDDFTIIDWEFFTETAPSMADRVGVWLGYRHGVFKSWGAPPIDELAAEFLTDFENAPGGQPAAVLALLHLSEMGIDLARYLTGDRSDTL